MAMLRQVLQKQFRALELTVTDNSVLTPRTTLLGEILFGKIVWQVSTIIVVFISSIQTITHHVDDEQ